MAGWAGCTSLFMAGWAGGKLEVSALSVAFSPTTNHASVECLEIKGLPM